MEAVIVEAMASESDAWSETSELKQKTIC